ncbi:tumor protein p53-inducible protein 11 [Caerostris darwini]|uniref:Tumor protein p53-inducible protein 11 n=1 Tax=Caerostris darwini TaxID=1538125 RepID=A0AAV4MZG2_9ARAC|nr:tumor protein p53-inducible protein 11 [Caerostris darwini]
MPKSSKHSSGDLHSRLKTRKILGVGETDNGDIHRSKISQLLGHNEHLYVKFPRGYWMWHLSVALIFTLLGLNNLFFPENSYDLPRRNETSHQDDLACRFYGCTSLVNGLLWTYCHQNSIVCWLAYTEILVINYLELQRIYSVDMHPDDLPVGLPDELAHPDLPARALRARAAQRLLLPQHRLLRPSHAQVHLLQQPEGLRLQQQLEQQQPGEVDLRLHRLKTFLIHSVCVHW